MNVSSLQYLMVSLLPTKIKYRCIYQEVWDVLLFSHGPNDFATFFIWTSDYQWLCCFCCVVSSCDSEDDSNIDVCPDVVVSQKNDHLCEVT